MSDFYVQAEEFSKRRNLKWYHDNLLRVLEVCKEKRVKDIDASIELALGLNKVLDDPVEKPMKIPLREVLPSELDSTMLPVEPALVEKFYKDLEKGGTGRYLNVRNHKSPEEKFQYRLQTSWDYGWKQKQSRQRARDVFFGRRALIREAFYRRNNLGPDPPHTTELLGSEYLCRSM